MSASATPPPAGGLTRWPTERLLIAIDGIDGSGKSVLARALAAALERTGVKAALLAIDDFRRPVDFAADPSREGELYYARYYDLAAVEAGLAAFAEGAAELTIPAFDSTRNRLDGSSTIRFAGARAIIVEGVFALRIPTVSRLGTVIYVQTSLEEARRRILARDMARGRSSADVEHRIGARYFPAHEQYVRDCAPLTRADLLVTHEQLGRLELVRAGRQSPAGRPPGDPQVTSALEDAVRTLLPPDPSVSFGPSHERPPF